MALPGQMAVNWRVDRSTGEAGAHLARPAPEGRAVRVVEVTRPAVLLGSAQPAGDVDEVAAGRAGVEVVRRRTGGGAVLVEPGAVLWLDVYLPPGDPRWEADVGRAFHWLGAAWAEALGGLGLDARWHDGAIRHTDWSRRVCFAGVGPGEVLVEGRKVVGLAQRRTREFTLFQCCALLAWNPGALLDLLALSAEERAAAEGPVAEAAAGIGAELASALPDAFVETLARY
jgi:lipoate-protein ligase A